MTGLMHACDRSFNNAVLCLRCRQSAQIQDLNSPTVLWVDGSALLLRIFLKTDRHHKVLHLRRRQSAQIQDLNSPAVLWVDGSALLLRIFLAADRHRRYLRELLPMHIMHRCISAYHTHTKHLEETKSY